MQPSRRNRSSRPEPVEYKRPWATYYYVSIHDPITKHLAQGACSSDRGGIRATVARVFDEQWAKALIVNRESGHIEYTIKRVGVGISIHYGSKTEEQPSPSFQQHGHLRRVA